MVNINDLFWTVQGEGRNAGRRSLFVRMPFCNFKCSWCDTEFNSYKPITESELETFAKQERGRFAVLTGGEPTMNKHLPKVIRVLKGLDFEIAVETNGTFQIPEGIDWVTVSPKREGNYFINADAYEKANEFKYVVDDGFDFRVLHAIPWTLDKYYYLSPEFNEMDKNVKRIEQFIKENPEWRMSLQTHKWTGMK